MKLDSESVRQAFDRWIATTAAVVAEAGDAVAKPRHTAIAMAADGTYELAGDPTRAFRLVDGAFVDTDGRSADGLLRDARVTLDLPPSMFLFRELDFPAKALDFLDGVLRAQIDRFTPWTPAQVAFGHSAPLPVGHDRIKLTIAAAPLVQIMPIVRAFGAAGANAVVVAARREEDAGAPIVVHESAFRRDQAIARAQGLLKKALVGALAFAGLSAAASGLAGAWLDSSAETIASETRQWRQAQMSGARDPDIMLHKKKTDAPLTVLVIDQLARILPDDTFLREVTFGEGKMEIAGVSADATRLIGMLERAPMFSRATFSAPTTHAPNEPGDQFHIQAQVSARYGQGE